MRPHLLTPYDSLIFTLICVEVSDHFLSIYQKHIHPSPRPSPLVLVSPPSSSSSSTSIQPSAELLSFYHQPSPSTPNSTILSIPAIIVLHNSLVPFRHRHSIITTHHHSSPPPSRTPLNRRLPFHPIRHLPPPVAPKCHNHHPLHFLGCLGLALGGVTGRPALRPPY